MSRREQAVAMADAEIRRLFAAGYSIFRIAELYNIPRVRLTSDIEQMFDLDWMELPPTFRDGGAGIMTEGYLREAMADQIEAVIKGHEGAKILCLTG
tara:strand:- start:66 stop:356 length:291 start_codon:yes stop_codon:yes gene_type:complete